MGIYVCGYIYVGRDGRIDFVRTRSGEGLVEVRRRFVAEIGGERRDGWGKRVVVMVGTLCAEGSWRNWRNRHRWLLKPNLS